jgi:hypothetical protein
MTRGGQKQNTKERPTGRANADKVVCIKETPAVQPTFIETVNININLNYHFGFDKTRCKQKPVMLAGLGG